MVVGDDLVDKLVECAPIRHVDICETNRTATISVGRKCYLLLVGEELQRREIYTSMTSHLIASFFANPNKILCICHSGEVVEIAINEDSSEVVASTRLPVKNIVCAYFIPEGEKLFMLDEIGQLMRVHSDCTTQLICTQQFATVDSFAITDSYYVLIRGYNIKMVPFDESSGINEDSFSLKPKSLEHTNHFMRVVARDDFIAAAVQDGRVLIWSDVRSKGFRSGYHCFAWHQTTPFLALSPFGNVFTAGIEAVLCRCSKMGKPSFLPRLSCPVKLVTLSPDSSHIICVLEDNSLHVVLASTLSRLSSTSFIRLMGPFRSVFMSDPRVPNSVVIPGRVGAIAWTNPLAETISHTTSISLENNAMMTSSDYFTVAEARHELTNIAISWNHIATIEVLVGLKNDYVRFFIKDLFLKLNFQIHRLRFWFRQKENPCELKLLDTVELGEDEYEVAGYTMERVNENFIVCNKNTGAMQLWHENGEKSGWSYEAIHETKLMHVDCVSTINVAHLFAAGQNFNNFHNANCVSIVNTEERRVISAIPCEAIVLSVAWADSHLLLISTAINVFCWDSKEKMLRWSVAESFNLHLSLDHRCFVYSENQAIEIDFETGKTKKSFEFSRPIQKLVAFSNHSNAPTLVGLADKVLYFWLPVFVDG
ncbi:hypothetical protein WR25_18908 isoform C [Diploscapter pachys]|uniref:Uncharacterized protein n=1 Tax=Diploscapter pachys TaxID=2018661 RepID=A0A2A2KH32_9BILA|nr:hypothetical protein WR25_18908 isoform C [Diploscapter pachys]